MQKFQIVIVVLATPAVTHLHQQNHVVFVLLENIKMKMLLKEIHAKIVPQVNTHQKQVVQVSAQNAMLVNTQRKQELLSVKIVVLTHTQQKQEQHQALHVKIVQMDGYLLIKKINVIFAQSNKHAIVPNTGNFVLADKAVYFTVVSFVDCLNAGI